MSTNGCASASTSVTIEPSSYTRSTRSLEAACLRRTSSSAASAPRASTAIATSLRSIARLLRLRAPTARLRLLHLAQTVLQVVEDETRRRLGHRRRDNRQTAVASDEDVARRRCDLDLHRPASVQCRSALQQFPPDGRKRRAVALRPCQHVSLLVDDRCLLDLRGKLRQ